MADKKISALIAATTPLAGTEVLPIVQSGSTVKASINNVLSPAAGNGVNFAANTPAAGKTSQLLNWYEEGTWTPGQGSGLTVTGSFSSSGTYTRIGRLVFVKGKIQATSISSLAGNEFVTGLPFSAVADCVGSCANAGYTSYTGIRAVTTTLQSVEAQSATASMAFSLVYHV